MIQLISDFFSNPAAVATLVVAIISLYANFRNAKSARKLPFLQRQFDLSFDACEVVATLATTTDRSIWEVASKRFWQLQFGQLAIVQDLKVKEVMDSCAEVVKRGDYGSPLPLVELQPFALKLAEGVRRLLLQSWLIKSLAPRLRGHASVSDVFNEVYLEKMDASKKFGKGKSISQ